MLFDIETQNQINDLSEKILTSSILNQQDIKKLEIILDRFIAPKTSQDNYKYFKRLL